MKGCRLLVLALLALSLSSCGILEFFGIVTGDADPERAKEFADRNQDGVIDGFMEYFWLWATGAGLAAVKTARMAGISIPNLDPLLDKIGLGRMWWQQRRDKKAAKTPEDEG